MYIYSGPPWHCGCTARMEALEKFARDVMLGEPGGDWRDHAHEALAVNPGLAAS